MRYVLLLCLFALPALALDATMIVLPRGGTNGQTVNAAYLNTNTIGVRPEDWTLTGAAGVLDTNYSLPVFVPAVIGGTNYFGVTSYAIRVSHGSEQQFRIAWPSGQRTNSLTFGLWMWNTSDGDGNKDVVSMVAGAGDSATLQLNDGTYIPHTDFGGGAGVPIDIDHTKPHWFEATFRQNGGDMDVAIYNTNGVLVGQSDWPITSDSAGVTSFNVGNINPHGDNPAGDIYFSPIVLVARGSNDVIFPLGVSAVVTGMRSRLKGLRLR